MRQYDADFERRSFVQRAQELLAAARKRPSRMSALPVVVNRKRKICESSSEDEVRRTLPLCCSHPALGLLTLCPFVARQESDDSEESDDSIIDSRSESDLTESSTSDSEEIEYESSSTEMSVDSNED